MRGHVLLGLYQVLVLDFSQEEKWHGETVLSWGPGYMVASLVGKKERCCMGRFLLIVPFGVGDAISWCYRCLRIPVRFLLESRAHFKVLIASVVRMAWALGRIWLAGKAARKMMRVLLCIRPSSRWCLGVVASLWTSLNCAKIVGARELILMMLPNVVKDDDANEDPVVEYFVLISG